MSETKAEIALRIASNVKDPFWAAKKLLSDEHYRELIRRFDVAAFDHRELEAWQEYMHSCRLINDQATADRLTIRQAPRPQAEKECAEESKERNRALRFIYDQQDASLKELKRAYLDKLAEIQADRYEAALALLLEMVGD